MNWGRSMGSSHRRIRRVGAVFGVATLLLLTVAFMALRPSQTEDATVTRVYDGDTIEALVSGRSEKIRYIGIDTPEMDDPRPAVLEMAQEAAQANRELVGGRTVRLELDVQERDRYGRLLAYVWLGDTLVNEWLVREGYAAARSFPPTSATRTGWTQPSARRHGPIDACGTDGWQRARCACRPPGACRASGKGRTRGRVMVRGSPRSRRPRTKVRSSPYATVSPVRNFTASGAGPF